MPVALKCTSVECMLHLGHCFRGIKKGEESSGSKNTSSENTEIHGKNIISERKSVVYLRKVM